MMKSILLFCLIIISSYSIDINSNIIGDIDIDIELDINLNNDNDLVLCNVRKNKVKDAMIHSWNAYKLYAYGKDEIQPMTKSGVDNWGGIANTLVDSLDTLWLMNMTDEFNEAKYWIKDNLKYDKLGLVSVLEITIRSLGGLLSAYDLSKDEIFLIKAKELGLKLINAFDTPTGIAYRSLDMKTGTGSRKRSGEFSILSELGSLQLEFRYLSYILKDKNIENKAIKGIKLLANNNNKTLNGLYPTKIGTHSFFFANKYYSFGAEGDSFYEYLLKMWLQGNKKEMWLRKMYDDAINGAILLLLKKSIPSNYVYLSEYDSNSNKNILKMDHLSCYTPGMLALGAYSDPNGIDSFRAMRDLKIAKDLMNTCYQMYNKQITGLAPEFVNFYNTRNDDFIVSNDAPYYILRPEVVESLFILHQLTNNSIYRKWSWNIFKSINKYCKKKYGFASLKDVRYPKKGNENNMESFFLSETLKYLYLIHDNSYIKLVDLTKIVLNTEAHPLTIFNNDHTPIEL